MTLFNSDFMRRARYLPENKRAFLLDHMEQTRMSLADLIPLYNNTPRYEIQKRKETYTELNTSLQTGIIGMWFLLDSPRERTVFQIEQRLKEINSMVKGGHFKDLYAAMQIVQENDEWEKQHWSFSHELVPKDIRTQYQTILEDYCQLPDTDRQKFIGEVTHPYSQFQTNRPFLKVNQRA